MSSDDYQDSGSNALVPRPGTGLAETGRRTHPVLARMSRDLLARAEAQGLSTARYRLGKYVLREPDYRQILDWAEALGAYEENAYVKAQHDYIDKMYYINYINGDCDEENFLDESDEEYLNSKYEWSQQRLQESVLSLLEKSSLKPEEGENFEAITLVVEDGTILSLAWDFASLPFTPEPWRAGLKIRTLGLIGLESYGYPYDCGDFSFIKRLSPMLPELQILRQKCQTGIKQLDLSGTPELTVLQHAGYYSVCEHYDVDGQLTKLDLTPIPRLKTLECCFNRLTELNLKPVQNLTELDCSYNELTELNLPVPGLTALSCSKNQLTDLDLSSVPGLTKLACLENQLTKLDLTPVPGLTGLWCGWNQLTELDLTPVPRLTSLVCHGNELTDLDLTPVPRLTSLTCSNNELTDLDLTPVPRLTTLDCSANKLTELDLTPVPGLTSLNCSDNPLTTLDLTPVPKLTSLDCRNNQLNMLDLTPVPRLTTLDCSSNRLTDLDLTPVPALTELYCASNQLTDLDLTPVPGLTWLNCCENKFTELDLTPVPNLTELWCDESVRLINPSANLKINEWR